MSSKLTKAQKRAESHLELYGIVHFLLTEKRCPVIFNGKLAYVNWPGVSKESFRRAIDRRVLENLCAYLDRVIPSNPKSKGGAK